jgi:hypothetical protein
MALADAGVLLRRGWPLQPDADVVLRQPSKPPRADAVPLAPPQLDARVLPYRLPQVQPYAYEQIWFPLLPSPA